MKFVSDDPNNFQMDSMLKCCFAIFDLRMMYDACLGDHYIMDFANAKLGHIVKFTPVLVKKSYTLIQVS